MCVCEEMIKLTWYCQCNFITAVWCSWSFSLCSITGVFTCVRLSNRTECEFLSVTENVAWTVFIPAVLPASDSFSIYVTSESDCLSSEYMLSRFDSYCGFWCFCTMTTIQNEIMCCFYCMNSYMTVKHIKSDETEVLLSIAVTVIYKTCQYIIIGNLETWVVKVF